MSIKKQLKKLMKGLPKGGRLFMLYEGERLSPNHPEHPGDLVIALDRAWRPEGEALPEHVEIEPGYVRPQNWRAIEAAQDREPGRIEFV